MGDLFYNILGNSAGSLTNTSPFSNIMHSYWSATEYVPGGSTAWYFKIGNGEQTTNYKNFLIYAWAVHSGDVGTGVVPVPAAVWLFSSGLLGLLCFTRRKIS